jgi:tRNA dimethylallyltransferase
VAEAAEETIVATRQFARRQLTWFRADPRILWLDWQDTDLVEKAAALCQ